MRPLQRLGRWETLLAMLIAVAVWEGSRRSDVFFTTTNLSFGTADLMEKAIMALPLALLIIAGEIDLSIASILGLSSAVLGKAVASGWPLWLAIVAALAVGAACGFFNGILVTRFRLPSLVVTLGTLALFRGLAYVVLGDEGVSTFPAGFTSFGFDYVPGTLVPWPFVVFAGLAVVFTVVLHGTWIGRQIYAVGANPEAAVYSGVRSDRLKLWLFVASGLMAAVAGVIFTARFASARADNAVGFELDVIAAVLLGGISIFGGRGTLVGVVLALVLIGAVRTGLSLDDVTGEVQDIAVGALLILSVLLTGAAGRVRLRRRRIRAPATADG